ncbi:MAG: hypothetical protein AAFQ87_18180, partial [Bacteroidota bacterium]
MKKTFLSLLPLLALLFILGACGSESTTTDTPSENAETESTETTGSEAVSSNNEGDAICLWPKVGLRDAPGTGNGIKYLTTILFGEAVSPTGETKEVGNGNYIEVSLSDGKTGWVKESLFAPQASVYAASGEIDVYPRPDLMTYKGQKFNRGDVVAVTANEQDEWIEVYDLYRSSDQDGGKHRFLHLRHRHWLG